MDEREKNQIEAWKVLVDLWKSENAVKTSKLMMFFAVQSLFVVAFSMRTGFDWVVPVLALLFSVLWFFCIGRTVACQKHWKKKADGLFSKFSEESKEAYGIFPTPLDELLFPIYGRMPATYILLFPPVLTFVIWLIILVFILSTTTIHPSESLPQLGQYGV